MEKIGKYRGWKDGRTCGYDLGNNKAEAIKEAKRLGLDNVLRIAKKGEESGEWVWER